MESRSLIISIVYLALIFGVSCHVKTPIDPTSDSHILEDFRLPLSIIPFHYKLRILPILDETEGYDLFTAPGTVRISINCHNLTNEIILHANNLTIDVPSVSVADTMTGDLISIREITFNVDVNFLQIVLEQHLEVGKQYIIHIKYIAQIPSDPLNGMYQDYYDDLDTGVKNYVATTLFAPYHARKAFPCFDEPDLRSTFDITVGRPESYHSMSNGELLSTTAIPELPGWYWDTFETTPSISPYIIAMIVSNFAYEEAATGTFRNVTMRTYAAPYQIERGGGKYAVNLAGNLLTYFEEFFKVEYPLTKSYSVALPHFFFNAMENWGLITYKEPVILYFPDETTELERYQINYVTSHELAHQWFGNLVNCKWWAYVWLKEGFATFYAHYGMNQTNPELLPWTEFPLRVRQVAMDFDATKDSHPLENYPETSAAVANIYTRIPYEKGASILRMASKFLTEPVFHEGIRHYLDTFQYKGATQDDLFEMLQEVTPEGIAPARVKTILDTWTTQKGFPLLKVSSVEEGQLLISQEKFIAEDTSDPDATWWVPVTIWPSENSESPEDYPDAWIPQGVRQILLNVSSEPPYILNPRSIGYYLVQYDENLTEMIQKQLDSEHEYFPASTRIQIQSDFLTLALCSEKEYVQLETVLDLTKYLHREMEVVVWKLVMSRIKLIYNLFVGTEYFPAFKDYWIGKLEAALNSDVDFNLAVKPTTLKIELTQWLSLLEASNFDEQSKQIMKTWMANPQINPIPVDLQDSVYCSVIRSDETNEIWKFIHYQYITTKSSVLRNRFAKALTCSTNNANINSLLTQLISDKPEIRDQERGEILEFIAENPRATSLNFNFIKENIEELNLFLTSKSIVETVSKLSAFMKTEADLQLLQQFVTKESSILTTGQETLHAAVRKVQSNIGWFERHSQTTHAWFNSQLILLKTERLK